MNSKNRSSNIQYIAKLMKQNDVKISLRCKALKSSNLVVHIHTFSFEHLKAYSFNMPLQWRQIFISVVSCPMRNWKTLRKQLHFRFYIITHAVYVNFMHNAGWVSQKYGNIIYYITFITFLSRKVFTTN